MALTFTFASNVGVIISVAPFFTALLAHWVFRGAEPLRPRFSPALPRPWRCVPAQLFRRAAQRQSPCRRSVGTGRRSGMGLLFPAYPRHWGYGFGAVQVTRRVFFSACFLCCPPLPFPPFDLRPALLAEPQILLNLLFLGLGASALCFVTWNFAVRVLGPVRTSAYIYAVPVVTLAASALLLHETITPAALCRHGLTLTGLFLSESGNKAPKKERSHVEKIEEKCVLVLHEALPRVSPPTQPPFWALPWANSAPIAGPAVADAGGCEHLGIVQIPIPVLRASGERLQQLRQTLYRQEYGDLTVVDFQDLAQSCHTYDQYILRMAGTPGSALHHLALPCAAINER